MTRGNWTDEPCWYASVQDAGRTALVLGPFPTEESCREWAYDEYSDAPGGTEKHRLLVNAACERDPKAWFYSWGMVKMQNGHREGVMNRELPDSEEDATRAAIKIARAA